MSLSLAAGRQLAESFPLMTGWAARRCVAADKSGPCYVVDGEVGHDPDALSNGDHRTRLDQLLALGIGDQPASLGMGPPRAGIKVPQDE